MKAFNTPIRATVAHLIVGPDRFLMVQEKQDDQIVINQPAGHIEPGEDILSALKRETFEETGLEFEPQGFLGIYQSLWQDKGRHYLRFCFVSHTDTLAQPCPQDPEIIQAFWLSRDEILNEGRHTLRSELVKICLDDYASKTIYPLELVQEMIRSDSQTPLQ